MSRTRTARAVARTAGKVTARRFRQGPQHPSWEWQYEIIITWLRERFRNEAPLHVVRRWLNDAGGMEERRKRVVFEAANVSGLFGEWVIPPDPTDAVVLYLHGGGYAFGSVRSHRGLTSAIARAAHCRVLSLEYRLAPEHPCPAAIEDVLTAVAWLQEQGVPLNKLHIGGDSAGGGLTVAALQALRDAGTGLPAGGVLLSPWVDLAVTGASARRFEDDDYLGTGDKLYEFAAYYAGDKGRRDPQVSPLYGDFTGLPRLLVLAGGVELLLDDSLRLVDKAREAGVPVNLHVEPDEVHVYPMFADLTSRAREGIARIGAFVREGSA